MELVDVRIPADSKSVGKKLKDIALPAGSVLTLVIRRDQKPLLASQDVVIQNGDQIIALTPSDTEEQLTTALRGG
jgi:Trk K+ transport system NAD-binding subunit